MNQIGLFGQSAPEVVPIEPSAAQRALAASLPNRWRLGTSSWSFEGWSGRLWRGKPSASTLSRHGLRAYSHHPLMRAVGVDRTFYKPEPAAIFADWRAQVPDDFRFLVKAHDHLTLARFPRHPRYGELAGQENPRFLDVAYARDVVIGPAVEGLGHTLGTLLFQFPPQRTDDLGRTPRDFAIRLFRFLRDLPSDVPYSVELRNAWALGADYAGALRHSGASHCFNIHPTMPGLAEQEQVVGRSGTRRIVRWMLHPQLDYQRAVERFRPFTALAEPDTARRNAISDLITRYGEDEALVIVNNKAEGCSPASVEALAEAITSSCRRRRTS